ncbi:MAG: hypothetical protein OES38_04740 [Gammaproteobacteria bacterium]|nr:hypothetical protein [Gammaproteobacteria bacterium]
MSEIAFLLGDVAEARNDNHLRLPAGFRAAGWRVTELPHDCVNINNGSPRLGPWDPDQFDLIWPLGFGRQLSFFDRMQLLQLLDQSRFVNTPDALVYLHGKYRWLDSMPETHAGNDVQALAAVIAGGGDWVLKPPAGSYGRDVRLIREGDDPGPALAALAGGEQALYCIVQRYLPEITRGETRTLIAGADIVGSYLRIPADGLLANLSSDGEPAATALDATTLRLVQTVAEDLQTLGVGFAAVDTAGGYLMEVNIANPGGLGTLESVYGKDPTAAAVAAIIAQH